jgi:hypothetical protein
MVSKINDLTTDELMAMDETELISLDYCQISTEVCINSTISCFL